jgi:hypothetical protein
MNKRLTRIMLDFRNVLIFVIVIANVFSNSQNLVFST